MHTSLLKYNSAQRNQIILELDIAVEIQQHLIRLPNELEVINYLLDLNNQTAAIQFLALGLPKREAAWWGYLAASAMDLKNPEIKVQNTLKICEQWVRTPGEDLRRQAKSAAESMDLSTSSSWVAMGIFWSGDNIAAINMPPVIPQQFMSGHAIYNALNMSINNSMENLKPWANYLLRQGIHISMGGNGKIAT